MDDTQMQQKLLHGFELMCDWYNANCVGITGQRVITSMMAEYPAMYVGIGTSGCSGFCDNIASYTPDYTMPLFY